MAVPSTKATLKSYCLRSLGSGVIDINVSDDQVDDRLDEALQYFAEYHYDGVERMYLKHQITSDDITRGTSDASTTATDVVDGSVTATWKEGKGYIPIPSTVLSVVNVFPFTDSATANMFDLRYQLRLNDLYDFSSTSIMEYQMTLQHLDFLEHVLVGEVPIRFSQHQQRLYLDMDWNNDVNADEYIRMVSLSRIMLTNIKNIQASWLTVGEKIAQLCLHGGANDFGSIMIEENVVSAAGAPHRFTSSTIQKSIQNAGFQPQLRNQKYEYRTTPKIMEEQVINY